MHAPSAHSRLLKQYPREGGREGCGGKIPKTRPLNTSALRIHPPYFLSSFLPIARLSFESLPPPPSLLSPRRRLSPPPPLRLSIYTSIHLSTTSLAPTRRRPALSVSVDLLVTPSHPLRIRRLYDSDRAARRTIRPIEHRQRRHQEA